MIIGQTPGDTPLAQDLRPGEGADGLRYGSTRLKADSLMTGGFDNLRLLSNGLLSFDGDVNLHMNQSLDLYAGALSLAETSAGTTRVDLSAPYLRLSGVGTYHAGFGLIRPRLTLNPTTQLSDATLHASADLLDVGNGLSFGTQGSILQLNAPEATYSRRAFALVDLDSRGDLRFLAPNDGADRTRLWTPGDLNLGAAQIYPASGVQAQVRVGYQDAVAQSEHTLRISGHGSAPAAVPYSVFGTLSFSAAFIEQGGVVRAPLGKIVLGDDSLVTSHEVRLLSGSTTSVSGAGLVMPYGGTTDGIDYLYNGKSVVLNGITGESNGVAIGGQYVEVQKGALIDLSGGGDLRGAGFVSGRGGSTDARFNPLVRNATDGTFSLCHFAG
jgi:hypothetical protein